MSDDLKGIAEARDTALARTDGVLREVRVERAWQLTEWGWGLGDGRANLADPAAVAHDDAHPEGDWSRFVVRHLGRAEQAIEDNEPVAWRRQMLRVAALAVAAVESHDRRRLAMQDLAALGDSHDAAGETDA
jgi:hypothetical protein